jgi:drug/metabolite transporter (DMT)-like permease
MGKKEKKQAFITNLSLFLLFLVWSNSYTLIKIAGRELQPNSIAILRFIIIFPFLFLFPSLYKLFKIDKRDLPKIIFIGILIVPLYHILLNTAETMINASVAALVAGFSPVITAVLSSIFLNEKMGRGRVAGLIISFIGVIILNYGISYKFEVRNTLGVLLSLSAVSSWAISTVLSKSLYKKYRPLDVTVWGIFIGTFLLVFFIKPQFINEVKNLSIGGWLAIAYLGFLAALIGYAVWFKALEHKEASSTAAFIYINPVLGTLSGVLFLKEKLTPVMILGGIIIILGLLFVNPLKMESG